MPTLTANAVLASSGLRDSLGANPPTRLADLTDSPSSPDANWWEGAAEPWSVRLGFPDPGSISGTQSVSLLLRRGDRDMTARVSLLQGGAFIRQLTETTLTSQVGHVVTATFDASEVSGPVELRVDAFWPLLAEEILLLADGVPFTFEVKGTNDPAKPFLVSHHGLGTMSNGDFYNAGTVTTRNGFKSFSPWFNSPRFPNSEYQLGGYPDGNRTAEIEQDIVDAIRAYQGQPSQTALIFGHSAGGQYLSRVAAYAPVTNVQRYIVANPSTHVFPDGRDAPYGFGALGYTQTQLDDAVKAYLQRPVTVYVGELDTGSVDLADPDNNLGQGTQRRDRAENVYAAAVAAASSYGVPLGWEKIYAPGLAHEGTNMLNATAFDLAAAPPSGDHAVRLAVNAGVGSGLKLAFDPASTLTYGGSGQHAYDLMRYVKFALGNSTTTGEASEPTFTGTAGSLSSSAYFAFGGGDWLTLDGSNPTWMDNIHKSGSTFTIAFMAYVGAVGATQDVLGNRGGGASGVGFALGFSSSGSLNAAIRNGSGNAFAGSNSATGALSGEWAVYMWSFQHDVSRRLSRRSASGYVTATGTSALTTPSTAASSYPMQIGSRGDGTVSLSSGARLGPLWIWEGVALTDAQLQTFSAAALTARG